MNGQLPPEVFELPEADRATGVLLLATFQQLIEQKLWCTEGIVAALWHAAIEGEWAVLPDGRKFYKLSGNPKVTDPTLHWLASATQREFLATALFYMDEEAQNKVFARWNVAPQEKAEFLAGFRRFQAELKGLWQELQSKGWVRSDLRLLKGAA